MNEVASECCGSCEWYCWNGDLFKYNCHNPEIVKQHKQNNVKPTSLCFPDYYSPRNPIPIIDLPEVKKLVDALNELVGIIDGGDKTDSFTTQPANRILKALEAKNE